MSITNNKKGSIFRENRPFLVYKERELNKLSNRRVERLYVDILE
jgi:hypothetical protein